MTKELLTMLEILAISFEKAKTVSEPIGETPRRLETAFACALSDEE